MRNEECRLTRSRSSSGNWFDLFSAETGGEGGVLRCVVCDEELGSECEEEARARDSRHERAPFVGASKAIDGICAFLRGDSNRVEVDDGESAGLCTALLLLSSMGGACSLKPDTFSPSSLSAGLCMDPSFRFFLLFSLLEASLLYVAVLLLPETPFPGSGTCDLEILPKAWMPR